MCINDHYVGITTWGFQTLWVVGLRYNVGIAYVSIFIDGWVNNLMWVLPKFVLVYGFIM
jgi:hypothetical protein